MRTMTLEGAVAIAREAHARQVDKAGRPYIEHPLRVMAKTHSTPAKMAAVLHDVLEDTHVTAEALLARGCPREVVDAIAALTRRKEEPYDDFVRRAAANPIAREVKYADLRDNSNVRRLSMLPAEKAQALRSKYANAMAIVAACAECNAAMGALHLRGCGLEECPECRGRILHCGCLDEGLAAMRLPFIPHDAKHAWSGPRPGPFERSRDALVESWRRAAATHGERKEPLFSERVPVGRIGALVVRSYPPYDGRDPRTGVVVPVPAKIVVAFEPDERFAQALQAPRGATGAMGDRPEDPIDAELERLHRVLLDAPGPMEVELAEVGTFVRGWKRVRAEDGTTLRRQLVSFTPFDDFVYEVERGIASQSPA